MRKSISGSILLAPMWWPACCRPCSGTDLWIIRFPPFVGLHLTRSQLLWHYLSILFPLASAMWAPCETVSSKKQWFARRVPKINLISGLKETAFVIFFFFFFKILNPPESLLMCWLAPCMAATAISVWIHVWIMWRLQVIVSDRMKWNRRVKSEECGLCRKEVRGSGLGFFFFCQHRK